MARETVLYAVPHDSCGMNGGPSAAYYFAVYITYIQHDEGTDYKMGSKTHICLHCFLLVFLFPNRVGYMLVYNII